MSHVMSVMRYFLKFFPQMLFINDIKGPCSLFNPTNLSLWVQESGYLSPDNTPDNPSSPSIGMDGCHPAAIQPHWWHVEGSQPGSPMHTGQEVHIGRTQTSIEFHYSTDHYIPHTVQCRYNMVNLLHNPHNTHPIACPWRRDKGCLLWF